MCTVTFVPLVDGGYVLTTNRDESHRRAPAKPPTVRSVGGRSVLAPTDADAGGTWVAADEAGRTVCLLNGDGPAGGVLPDDPPSRGLLVWELMQDPSHDGVRSRVQHDVDAGDFRYRPFKLVVVEPGSGRRPPRLLLAGWDAAELSFGEAEGPSVAISSTFERLDVTARRTAAWEAFLAEGPEPGPGLPGALAAFHAGHEGNDPQGDAYSVCVHRNDARTVSRTMVCVEPGGVRLEYQAGWPCESGPVVTVHLQRS